MIQRGPIVLQVCLELETTYPANPRTSLRQAEVTVG